VVRGEPPEPLPGGNVLCRLTRFHVGIRDPVLWPSVFVSRLPFNMQSHYHPQVYLRLRLTSTDEPIKTKRMKAQCSDWTQLIECKGGRNDVTVGKLVDDSGIAC
jgi:hypothetical protein